MNIYILLLILIINIYNIKSELINFNSSKECFKLMSNKTIIINSFPQGLDNVTTEMVNDPCGEFGTCYNRNKTSTFCYCENGKKGSTCDTLVVPLALSYYISGLILAITAITSIGILIRHNKNNKDADFEEVHGRAWTWRFGETTRTKKIIIMIYRLSILTFCLGVHLSSVVKDQGSIYKYYTVLNMIFMITTFGIGSALSIASVFFSDKLNSKFIVILHKIHWVFFEVEISAACLVDVVTWAILFPPCLSPCGLLSFNSFVQHLLNVFFLLGDFLLASHKFALAHVGYCLIWPCLYGVFHLIWTSSQDSTLGHAPVYFFLNMGEPFAPVYVIGVIIVHSLFFFMWFFISKQLEKCTSISLNDEHKKLIENNDVISIIKQ